MSFDYSRYVRTCLVVPVIVLLPCICMFINWIFCFIKLILQKRLSAEKVFKVLLGIAISGFFLWLEGGQLFFHGGIHLLCEKEADAVEIHGNITKMRKLGEFYFSVLKSSDGESNGIEFTVNGIQCIAIEEGLLEVGDYVTVKYLPKSGYILYIAEVGEENSDIG